MDANTRAIQIAIAVISAAISIIYYTISNFKENKIDKIIYKIDAIYFLTLYLCAISSYHCI